jgi:hypothetical protein
LPSKKRPPFQSDPNKLLFINTNSGPVACERDTPTCAEKTNSFRRLKCSAVLVENRVTSAAELATLTLHEHAHFARGAFEMSASVSACRQYGTLSRVSISAFCRLLHTQSRESVRAFLRQELQKATAATSKICCQMNGCYGVYCVFLREAPEWHARRRRLAVATVRMSWYCAYICRPQLVLQRTIRRARLQYREQLYEQYVRRARSNNWLDRSEVDPRTPEYRVKVDGACRRYVAIQVHGVTRTAAVQLLPRCCRSTGSGRLSAAGEVQAELDLKCRGAAREPRCPISARIRA